MTGSSRNLRTQDPSIVVVERDGIAYIARIPKRRKKEPKKFSLCLLLEGGSSADKIPGIAHIDEHLRIGAMPLSKFRGSIDGSTGTTATYYEVSVPKGREMDAIWAAARLVCKPFPCTEKLLSHERNTVLNEWAWRKMDSNAVRRSRIVQAAYGEHPLTRRPIGTEEGINSITRNDIAEYRKNNCIAENLIVAMEGDLEPHRMINLVSQHLSLPHGQRRLPPEILDFIPSTLIIPTNLPATNVYIVVQGIPMAQWDPLSGVARDIVCRMVMADSGPVLAEARHKNPLVYTVENLMEGSGNFHFSALAFDLTTRTNNVTAGNSPAP